MSEDLLFLAANACAAAFYEALRHGRPVTPYNARYWALPH